MPCLHIRKAINLLAILIISLVIISTHGVLSNVSAF